MTASERATISAATLGVGQLIAGNGVAAVAPRADVSRAAARNGVSWRGVNMATCANG